MSANHSQDFEGAVKILQAAKDSGADAIKIQTYTADTLTINSDQKYFKIEGGTLWDGMTLYELYRKACTPWEWHPKLKHIAEGLGLIFFSTAFDFSAVHFLEELGVPVHKVSSFELVDLPLIEEMARTGKPLIISTGMASFEEIREAVEAARRAGAEQMALLKCTSAYPAPPESMNLRAIPRLQQAFDVQVGLSDHTLGVTIPIAAVSLGACIIEKHFTLSRSQQGPDSAFSLEPSEFKSMVNAIRCCEKAIAGDDCALTDVEKGSQVFRRSLFAVEEIKAGELLTPKNVRSIRPGNGLPPKYLSQVLGKRATRDLPRGTPLSWDVLE